MSLVHLDDVHRLIGRQTYELDAKNVPWLQVPLHPLIEICDDRSLHPLSTVSVIELAVLLGGEGVLTHDIRRGEGGGLTWMKCEVGGEGNDKFHNLLSDFSHLW